MHENVLKFPNSSVQTRYQPYGLSNMGFKYQTTTSSNTPNHLPENENQRPTRLSVSPVLPGTGNVTHNVTRMLGNSEQTPEKQSSDHRKNDSPVLTYSTAHFMSFRHKALQEYTTSHNADQNHGYSESDNSASDMSISTERSISPPNSDTSPSIPDETPSNAISLNRTPSSSDESPSSKDSSQTFGSSSSNLSDEDTENTKKLPKKSARTNFTRDQVNALIKIFQETPYPDAEMMENIGKDLNIKEKQVKIWFQNKRARWRRRVNDKNNNLQHFLPTTPMMSSATTFGYMPTGHPMTSAPLHSFHGYMSYPWMQGYAGHNYTNQHFTGQNVSANQIPLNNGLFNGNYILKNNVSSATNTGSNDSTISSAQYERTLPQQNATNQNRHYMQFPGYMYASS